MNVINLMIGVLILGILVIIGYKLGQIVIELNTPITPKTNTAGLTISEQPMTSILRWNHFPLTVYIKDDFLQAKNHDYVDDVKRALDLWQSTGIVSFSIVNNPDANITIEWVPLLKEKSLDSLGNTDLRFVNVSQFGIIQKATVELLTTSESRQLNSNDMTNLALHEIGHALGLQHTSEDDIMNPVLVIPSKSVKDISTSDIDNLKKSYELAAKPDLKIVGLNATKFTFTRFGRDYFYLNVSISLQNIGPVDVGNFNVSLRADEIAATEETIPKLEVGNILNIFQDNLKIEKNFTSVQVIIDPQNDIDELNETNNLLEINV